MKTFKKIACLGIVLAHCAVYAGGNGEEASCPQKAQYYLRSTIPSLVQNHWKKVAIGLGAIIVHYTLEGRNINTMERNWQSKLTTENDGAITLSKNFGAMRRLFKAPYALSIFQKIGHGLSNMGPR